MTKKQKKMLLRIIIAAVMLAALYFLPVTGWLRLGLYLVTYLVIGYDILKKAGQGIANGRVFDENFLMAVATVGAFALEGDTAPESGVSTQAEETTEDTVTPTPIPTTGMTITEGGIYEVKGDTYTRSIIVTSSEPVTINITGNVTSTGDPFVSAQGSGKLEINNNGFTVNCENRHFLYTYTPADVTVDGGIYKTGGGIFLIMAFSGQLTLKNVDAWAEQASALTSAANVHVMDSQFHHTGVSGNKYAAVNNSATMTLNNVKIVSTEGAITNGNSATMTVDGGNYTSGQNYNCIKNDAGLFIIKDGTFIATGASCIDNNWGQVRINGGSFTTDAGIAVKNRGGLRLNGGTVEAPNGTAIDISGESGDVQLNGGTIRNSVTGVRVADAGDSEIALKAVTFENNTDDISLGNDQQINIKKTFTGKAKILVDDAKAGRRITQENDDARYQKDLKLVSNNEGYIVGYKREDGVEYRYLADANGNAVSTQDAKATADLGAGAQQLDTTDVVPEDTLVTVTANIPEGAEFLDWSVMADGQPLAYTPAEDDPQTITFKMPGCNVTVAALYQNNTPDPVNPGGGDDPVTEFFEAAAVTGVAAWGLYETATGIYRVLNMRGIPMPSNRAGLATLIWEKAGQPEPQTLKTYSDVDESDIYLRKAASWMEEQGLMEARDDGSFKPYGYVTKLRTCFVWDMARDRGLVG